MPLKSLRVNGTVITVPESEDAFLITELPMSLHGQSFKSMPLEGIEARAKAALIKSGV